MSNGLHDRKPEQSGSRAPRLERQDTASVGQLDRHGRVHERMPKWYMCKPKRLLLKHRDFAQSPLSAVFLYVRLSTAVCERFLHTRLKCTNHVPDKQLFPIDAK
jgi:hypothetical protein